MSYHEYVLNQKMEQTRLKCRYLVARAIVACLITLSTGVSIFLYNHHSLISILLCTGFALIYLVQIIVMYYCADFWYPKCDIVSVFTTRDLFKLYKEGIRFSVGMIILNILAVCTIAIVAC